MCYHVLYVFTICGHSIFREKPLRTCKSASIPPNAGFSTDCSPSSHPLHTYKLARLCLRCQLESVERLQVVREAAEAKFGDGRWKDYYGYSAVIGTGNWGMDQSSVQSGAGPAVLRAGYRGAPKKYDDEVKVGPEPEILVIPAPKDAIGEA